jgi:uncharacterized protein (TIGR00369 family)
MTGLEALLSMIAGDIPAPSISKTMGMKAISASKEMVEFEGIATNDHLNPAGGVHGGFAATILDSVTGCIVMANLEDVKIPYATLDLSVKMLRPVPKNQKLKAVGKLISISKRTAVSDGYLYSEENKLLAHATATCIITRDKT